MKIKELAAKRPGSHTAKTSPIPYHGSDASAGRVRTPARPLYIVDLEATCWDDRTYTVDEMEVIEIGCVLVTQKGVVLDEFSTFVRPKAEPELSEYCTNLTGIRQEDVDRAPTYIEAMCRLDQWMAGRLGIWGSWGNFDHRLFASMEQRCPTNSRFLSMAHVNLKRPWKSSNGTRRTALRAALEYHNLTFVGSPHRGLDDARNIARLMPFVDRHKLLAAVGTLGVITGNHADTEQGESRP